MCIRDRNLATSWARIRWQYGQNSSNLGAIFQSGACDCSYVKFNWHSLCNTILGAEISLSKLGATLIKRTLKGGFGICEASGKAGCCDRKARQIGAILREFGEFGDLTVM